MSHRPSTYDRGIGRASLWSRDETVIWFGWFIRPTRNEPNKQDQPKKPKKRSRRCHSVSGSRRDIELRSRLFEDRRRSEVVGGGWACTVSIETGWCKISSRDQPIRCGSWHCDSQRFRSDPCQIARAFGTRRRGARCHLFLPAPSQRWLPLPQTGYRNGRAGCVRIATRSTTLLCDWRPCTRRTIGKESGC